MHCISLAILICLSWFPFPAVGTNWPFSVEHQSINFYDEGNLYLFSAFSVIIILALSPCQHVNVLTSSVSGLLNCILNLIVSNLCTIVLVFFLFLLKPRCGLPISTYFSAVKIRWLLDNSRDVQRAIKDKRCLFGTVDSWLTWVRFLLKFRMPLVNQLL